MKLNRVIIETGDPKDDIVFMATRISVSLTREIVEVPGNGPYIEHATTGSRFMQVNAEFHPGEVEAPTKPERRVRRVAADGRMGWFPEDEERLKAKVRRITKRENDGSVR